MLGIDLTACWRPRAGMVTVALELARALHRRGVPLTLLCSRERPAGFEGARAILSPHRHEVANKLFWLPQVEAAAGLDAILYPYWPPPPRRRRGAPPAVAFVHDLAFRLRPDEVPWQQRLFLGSLLPPALRASALVLVPTETTRCDLLQEYPLPGLAGRVEVLPEGLPELPAPGPLPAGLAPGFLLAVGTVEPRKNYPRLLSAYRELRRRRPDAPPLVVAGADGWGRGGGESRLLASEPGVRHLGRVDDATLAALYGSAAGLAFPSLYEGFGLPLLEAMAHGVPALIGRSGALPELAGGAALEVDPRSVPEIADGLERLLGDEELRSALAASGPERARGFSWDAAAERLEALIGRLNP